MSDFNESALPIRCGAGAGEVFCDSEPDHLSRLHHDSATGTTWTCDHVDDHHAPECVWNIPG